MRNAPTLSGRMNETAARPLESVRTPPAKKGVVVKALRTRSSGYPVASSTDGDDSRIDEFAALDPNPKPSWSGPTSGGTERIHASNVDACHEKSPPIAVSIASTAGRTKSVSETTP